MISALITTCPNGFERRARRLPWGIQIEIWRRVEIRTLPVECAQLSLGLLFADDEPGVIPSSPNDDEKTLENMAEIGETTLEEAVDYEYGPQEQPASGERPAKEPK